MVKMNDFKVATMKVDGNKFEIELANGMGVAIKSDEAIGIGEIQTAIGNLVNTLYQKFPNIGYGDDFN